MTSRTKKSNTEMGVDDVPANTRLLKAKLSPEGYIVSPKESRFQFGGQDSALSRSVTSP
jgi:hypothetical protein